MNTRPAVLHHNTNDLLLNTARMRDAVHMNQLRFPINPNSIDIENAVYEGAALEVDIRKGQAVKDQADEQKAQEKANKAAARKQVQDEKKAKKKKEKDDKAVARKKKKDDKLDRACKEKEDKAAARKKKKDDKLDRERIEKEAAKAKHPGKEIRGSKGKAKGGVKGKSKGRVQALIIESR